MIIKLVTPRSSSFAAFPFHPSSVPCSMMIILIVRIAHSSTGDPGEVGRGEARRAFFWLHNDQILISSCSKRLGCGAVYLQLTSRILEPFACC